MIVSLIRGLALGGLLWLLLPLSLAAQEISGTPGPEIPMPLEVAQPAYEVFRINDGGIGRAYRVWEEWVPQIVVTPDGGAWTFFTAQVRTADGYGPRRLFAAHFDPARRVWGPAATIGALATQFGVSAVVDSKGTVHIVYSERALEGENTWSRLVYQRTEGNVWSEPAAIAPDANAGHQMLPALVVDGSDGLHVIWRDQRLVSAEERAALPTNADLMASDLVNGAWTTPQPINLREAPDLNPAWPRMVVDQDRLVAIWSLYKGSTAEEMKSAASVQWSSRPLAGGAWSTPQTLFVRDAGDAGGRLIDLAADPRGGAVVVFGLYNRGSNQLMEQRLNPGADAWSEPVVLAEGDFGYLPSLAIAADGTMYIVFNNGRNKDVDIGGLVVDPDGTSLGAVSLTPGEGGVTARASIELDANDTPWVVYMHQPTGSTNVAEIQAVRSANFAPLTP